MWNRVLAIWLSPTEWFGFLSSSFALQILINQASYSVGEPRTEKVTKVDFAEVLDSVWGFVSQFVPIGKAFSLNFANVITFNPNLH